MFFSWCLQPMHIHYTGWRQENNYVPMNFDGRHHSSGASDPSLSFDSAHYLQHHTHNTSTSSGPSSLLMRDPLFAPAPSSNNMMTHYEIHVDSSAADSRPRSVPLSLHLEKKKTSLKVMKYQCPLNCCY